MGRSEKKAIFTGRFDPFHIGHAYAITRSLEIADRVLVYVTKSEGKVFASPEERAEIIRCWLRSRVEDVTLSERVEVRTGDKKHNDFHKEGWTIEICGSDMFQCYNDHGWRSFGLTKEVIVIQRPERSRRAGLTMDALEACLATQRVIHLIPTSKEVGDCSATLVRKKIVSNEQIKGLVPATVEQMINETYSKYVPLINEVTRRNSGLAGGAGR